MIADTSVAQSAKVVKKSNALARARWSPDSVWEPRLVALLATKIKPDDIDFKTYDIQITEIIGSNPSGRDYLHFEKAVDKSMSRIITIRNDNGWSKYTLFSSCKLNRKKGILTIGIHPDLKEHFLQLKQYVKFNLTEFMLLPSTYSQRIFEIIKSWDDKNEIILNLSELHEILDTPKSFKNSYKDFRRFVLDKAHTDINKHTTLKYTWEPIKTGRAVTAIRFVFQKEAKAISTKLNAGNVPKTTPAQNETALAFESFFDKIAPNGNIMLRIQAHKLWTSLHESGNAPLAADVPDDNTLSVIDFLESWQGTNA